MGFKCLKFSNFINILVQPGVMIIVSPLLSLIQDQIITLNLKFGIPATFLNSQQTPSQAAAVLQELRKLLYVTPERIAGNLSFQETLKFMHRKGQLAGFVIDEAHCVRYALILKSSQLFKRSLKLKGKKAKRQ